MTNHIVTKSLATTTATTLLVCAATAGKDAGIIWWQQRCCAYTHSHTWPINTYKNKLALPVAPSPQIGLPLPPPLRHRQPPPPRNPAAAVIPATLHRPTLTAHNPRRNIHQTPRQ